MSDIKRYLCRLSEGAVLLGSTITSDTFGCTSADLEEYVSNPNDLQAIREMEVGQRYIDKDNDMWERQP